MEVSVASRLKYYFLFTLHISVILIILALPLFASSKTIVIGLLIYYPLRIFVDKKVGYFCPLSVLQFGSKTGFLQYYLGKAGLKMSGRQITAVFGYFFPIILLIVSVLLNP